MIEVRIPRMNLEQYGTEAARKEYIRGNLIAAGAFPDSGIIEICGFDLNTDCAIYRWREGEECPA